MSERQKLPPYIKALNIIMIVILLAICALIFALTMQAKDLGWDIPSASGNSQVSSQAVQTAETSDTADSSSVTVQASE